jgi:FkbM family methyltransferase
MLKKLKAKVNNIRLNYFSHRRKISLSRSLKPSEINHLKPVVNVKCSWYGNSYGGFYAIPMLLNAGSIVYSVGIGKDISFDRSVIKKHGCKVFAFDPTPKSIQWIGEQKLPASFHFYTYGISKQTGNDKFYLPENPRGVSGSLVIHDDVDESKLIEVPMKSLADVTRQLGHSHLDVLKIDIEGAEYDIIESILEAPVTINQILIEFHDRFFTEKENKSKMVVKKLQKHGYEIFAASTSYEEVSFIHSGALQTLNKV